MSAINERVVRKATVDDIPALWTLVASRADSKGAFTARATQKLRSADHFIAMAFVDGDVAGYAWAQDYGPHLRDGQRIARFHDLFVAERMRRRGIGRGLFERVKSWACDSGVSELQWQASPAAVGFYERLGLKGDPCPQPDFPFYEIEFTGNRDPTSSPPPGR